MKRTTLQSIKAKQNKWWMKAHFLFSLLIVFQVYSFDHQIEHFNDLNEKECVQCIVSNDYLDSFDNEVSLNKPIPNSTFTLNLGQSIYQNPPAFYCSRAPPKIS